MRVGTNDFSGEVPRRFTASNLPWLAEACARIMRPSLTADVAMALNRSIGRPEVTQVTSPENGKQHGDKYKVIDGLKITYGYIVA